MGKSLGAWAFIVGIIIAAIVAFVGAETVPTWAIFLLAVLGLVVGLLNITGKEVMPFLLAAIAFLVTFQSLSAIVAKLPLGVGAIMSSFFGLLIVFIGPAAAIVAFKELFATTKN
jgi:hypothetical protein